MLLGDYTASDFAWIALAAFLVLVGVGLFYFLFRLGETLGQVTKTVEHTEDEMLPVINKAGGTLDRVNRELDKVDVMTTSATDAVKAADTAVRTVSSAVTYPVQKIAGLTAAFATASRRSSPGATSTRRCAPRKRQRHGESAISPRTSRTPAPRSAAFTPRASRTSATEDPRRRRSGRARSSNAKVFTTLFVSGSISTTVRLPRHATHTAVRPVATSTGSSPARIVFSVTP